MEIARGLIPFTVIAVICFAFGYRKTALIFAIIAATYL